MTEQTVNIPLLRKAVEWAEAEAAKPWELCEWYQVETIAEPSTVRPSYIDREMGVSATARKSSDCGTCFCIAGYVVSVCDGPDYRRGSVMAQASELLGLKGENDILFAPSNTIEEVREFAESIAGERL
jgi:hypothetical protein